MTCPGEEGGECKRCGETTIMIGHGNAVFGTICPECDLIHVVGNSDVWGANPYDPEDEQ